MRAKLEIFPKIKILTIALFVFLGCEQNFSPIQKNNKFQYSITGILDLSADTQWVRVMPIRTTIFRDSVPNNATVTLIEETTGNRIQLEDSLFKLPQNSYVWNFFTTTQLKSNHTYTIEARSPEGEITSATATIPSDFSTPEIAYLERGNLCEILIDPIVEKIPVAEVTLTFQMNRNNVISDTQLFSISYINILEKFPSGYEMVFNPIPTLENEFNVNINNVIGLKGEVLIVSADTNWYEADGVEIPGLNSNVENGLGVVTGIVSKRLPLRPNVEGQEDLLFCPPL